LPVLLSPGREVPGKWELKKGKTLEKALKKRYVAVMFIEIP
jgi:hypothetical protein